ncbi:MAG: SoxR reducing system RseC family protein [Bacteroidales bacterium]|nr:SoxR reducing system RseC family protein [Bacteroidales bacterium]
MTTPEISHSGKIVDITPDFITVEIVAESACATCHAAGLCHTADAAHKQITVPATYGNWQPGQEVQVVLKRSMGFKAVWLSYAIPLVVLMAVLLGLLSAGFGELPSALIAIGAVCLYYLGLYLFKNKLQNEYSFYLKEK